MKVGDGSKPVSLPGGPLAKAQKVVEQGDESLGGSNLLRAHTAPSVDHFEKAAPPALGALLGAAPAVAAARSTAVSGLAQAKAALLGGLGTQLGRAESDTRALILQTGGLRSGNATAQGTARDGGDFGTALVEGLAAAADALARAQEAIAAESTLESMIGHAGRLVRGDAARDVEALSRGLERLKSAADRGKSSPAGLAVVDWTGENEAAKRRQAIDDLKQAVASVENQLQLILRQIEELRSEEAGEQDGRQADPGDPLAAVAQSVSDAQATIRDLFDP